MDAIDTRYVIKLENVERGHDSNPLFEFEHIDEDSKTGLLHAYFACQQEVNWLLRDSQAQPAVNQKYKGDKFVNEIRTMFYKSDMTVTMDDGYEFAYSRNSDMYNIKSSIHDYPRVQSGVGVAVHVNQLIDALELKSSVKAVL